MLTQTTVADLRNLIAETVIDPSSNRDRDHSLRWFAWRIKHRTKAKISHYLRRGDPLPAELHRWAGPQPAAIPP